MCMRKYMRYFLTGLMIATAASGYAIPAKPGILQFRQADSEIINVRLVGDENFHFYFTEDGYPIHLKDNVFYYCRINSDGTLTDSGIRAMSPDRRDAAAVEWLRGTDLNDMSERLQSYRTCHKPMGRYTSVPERADKPNRLFPKGPGLWPATTFPASGTQKVLVILVQFGDEKFRLDDANDYYTRMLNEAGFSDYGATGSAFDFFNESSCGMFTPQFDVYGPVTLSHNMEYYGGNDMNGDDARPAQMIAEACLLLDGEIDFSEYDRDHDGYVDNVYVYYAGLSEAAGGSADCIWPHAWFISADPQAEAPLLDNVTVDRYACSNEWNGETPCGIGTFVHEFSHVLGLPDLYSTSYTGAFTPNEWSTLDVGPYNNEGRTPPYFTAFERYALGWIKPTVIKGDCNITLQDISHNEACLIYTPFDNEYFLLENRQQVGWDTYIPGHGMLVWHIDYNDEIWKGNRVNNIPYHQYVDIVEADNKADYNTIQGDPFPGADGVTSFTGETSPALKTWDGIIIPLPITEIREDGDGLIRFKVGAGGPDTGMGSGILDFFKVEQGVIIAPDDCEIRIFDLQGKLIKEGRGEIRLMDRGVYVVNLPEMGISRKVTI